MSKISTGLNKLNWQTVLNLIKYLFSDTTIDITISTCTITDHIALVEPINVHLVQTRDAFLQKIIYSKQNPNSAEIKWLRKAKSYIINDKDNLLYYRDVYRGTPRLVLALSKGLIEEIIDYFHDEKMFGAHLGVHNVYNKIRSRYHWLTMHKTIKNYVISCKICQRCKPDKRPTVGMPQPNKVYQRNPISRHIYRLYGLNEDIAWI